MRFFAILLGYSLLLSACTLPGTQVESTDNTVVYEGTGFSLSIPKNWTEASKNSLPPPKTGKIEFASISPEVKYGFSNNLVVMSHILPDPITSKRYSELNQMQTSKNYLEYTKLNDEEIKFIDDEVSRVTTFEARYNERAPRMRFIQTARVCGTQVYLAHFSLSLEKDPALYIPLLKTLKCR